MAKAKAKGGAAAIYQRVTDTIVRLLEQGTVPWEKPWHAGGVQAPKNFQTDRTYEGINSLLLNCAQLENNFKTPYFLTFNQAAAVAGISPDLMKQVKDRKNTDVTPASVNHPLAGTKSCGFVMYPVITYRKPDGSQWKCKKDSSGRDIFPSTDEIKQHQLRKSIITKTTPVWNIDQMSYIPEKYQEMRKVGAYTPTITETKGEHDQRFEDVVQALISKNDIDINFISGDQAYYSPGPDHIVSPLPEQYKSREHYLQTVAHESMHWTGHPSRLERDMTGRFGSESYAFEELVAEIGAAYFCSHNGVQSFTQHAAYVESWLQVLKNDPQAIMKASKLAEKACDSLLMGVEPYLAQEKTKEERYSAERDALKQNYNNSNENQLER
ncbi:ArdC family protein [Neptuniibacter sp. QD37_11]|uniref:ArdC family protein n=1 Tax=Neptuniibacter sp. QD37_11 TaxID=3398209 RepID=UPI0039F53B75